MWQGGGETLVKVPPLPPPPTPPNPNLWSIKPTARHVVTFVLADILIDYVTETLLLSEGDAARLSPEADHGWLFPLAAGESSAHSCLCLMKVKQTNKQTSEGTCCHYWWLESNNQSGHSGRKQPSTSTECCWVRAAAIYGLFYQRQSIGQRPCAHRLAVNSPSALSPRTAFRQHLTIPKPGHFHRVTQTYWHQWSRMKSGRSSGCVCVKGTVELSSLSSCWWTRLRLNSEKDRHESWLISIDW